MEFYLGIQIFLLILVVGIMYLVFSTVERLLLSIEYLLGSINQELRLGRQDISLALLVRAKDKLLYCVREDLRLDRTETFATAAEEVRTLEAYTFAILYGDNVYKITGC